MIIRGYIENYGSQLFKFEVGNVFTNNLNETLDSFDFNITNESIDIDFYPFQYTHIVDIDNNEVDLYYVIDSFTKSPINLNNTKHFDYNLKVMSETKLLEKIVLPNRTIVHDIEQKTIAQVIKEMCDLYVPKYRTKENGELVYKPIFDYMSVVNDSKFSDFCPDLSWTKPDLRTVLTTLMTIKGCLPRIQNRTLTYVDLRQDFPIANLDGKNLVISESNSSDSYTNQLVSFVDNALDTENNKVLDEIIGFRDNENAIIKQLENLYLETTYPIDRVNSLYLNVQWQINLRLHSTQLDTIVYDRPFIERNIRHFNFIYDTSGHITQYAFIDSNHGFNLYDVTIEYYQIKANLTNGDENVVLVGTEQRTFMYGSSAINPTYYNVPQDLKVSFMVLRFTYNLEYEFTYNSMDSIGLDAGEYFIVYALEKFDITPLVKERQVRAALDVDVTVGRNYRTIEEFSTFYYTTLEYTYGGKRISGFSNSYEWFEWYGQQMQTFMEVIDSLSKETTPGFADFVDLNELISGYHFSSDTILMAPPQVYRVNPSTNMNKYSLYTFEINYVPFNTMQIRYSKKEAIKYPISTISNQDNSIIALDVFSDVEQQKVNRLGNNVCIIKQLHTTLDNTLELGQAIGDNIIFKKQVEFFSSFVNVVYTATKNYILRDFFTSIVKKYRAFQYFNVNDTILRVENKHYYIVLGTLSYATDFADTTDFSFEDLSVVCSPLYFEQDETKVVNYATVSVDNVNVYKYECSKLATGNSICLSYQEPFSNSYGSYIKVNSQSISDTTYRTNDYKVYYRAGATEQPSNDYFLKNEFGGFVQGRYIYESEYYTKHNVMFMNKAVYDFGDSVGKLGDNVNISEYGNLAYKNPKGDFRGNVFTLVDRYYYKSLNERINETIQFEYINPRKDKILFTRSFVERNIMLGVRNRRSETQSGADTIIRVEETIICIINTAETLSIKEDEHELGSDIAFFITIGQPVVNNRLPIVHVPLSDLPSEECNLTLAIRIAYYTNSLNNFSHYAYQDLIAFKKPKDETTDWLIFEVANTNNGKIYERDNISNLDKETSL